jgi:hypothetical protein
LGIVTDADRSAPERGAPYELSLLQAVSYCDTAAVLPAWLVEPEPLPAYTPPAVPPFSLNAEPGALEALPGSVGAVFPGPQLKPWVVPG